MNVESILKYHNWISVILGGLVGLFGFLPIFLWFLLSVPLVFNPIVKLVVTVIALILGVYGFLTTVYFYKEYTDKHPIRLSLLDLFLPLIYLLLNYTSSGYEILWLGSYFFVPAFLLIIPLYVVYMKWRTGKHKKFLQVFIFVVVVLLSGTLLYGISSDAAAFSGYGGEDIVVQNQLNEAVYLNDLRTFTIQKFEGGDWNTIDQSGNYSFFPKCICDGRNPHDTTCPVYDEPIPSLTETSSGKRIAYSWTGKQYIEPFSPFFQDPKQCSFEKNLPSGKYRINLSYSTDYTRVGDYEPSRTSEDKIFGKLDEEEKDCVEKEFNYPAEGPVELVIE